MPTPPSTEPTDIEPTPEDVDTSPRSEDGAQPQQEACYVEIEVADDDAVVVES